MHFYDLWKNTKGIKKFKNIMKADFRINPMSYFVNWESFEISEILLCFPLPPPKNIRAYWNKNTEEKRGRIKEPTT